MPGHTETKAFRNTKQAPGVSLAMRQRPRKRKMPPTWRKRQAFVAHTADRMARQAERLPNKWDPQVCRGFSEPELLLYRSNLLGSDLRITNYGGGNTSAKVATPDPLTREPVNVLWVKGSGGDLASMTLDGFATLYLEKLHALKSLYRGVELEDEMVGYLAHCTFNL